MYCDSCRVFCSWIASVKIWRNCNLIDSRIILSCDCCDTIYDNLAYLRVITALIDTYCISLLSIWCTYIINIQLWTNFYSYSCFFFRRQCIWSIWPYVDVWNWKCISCYIDKFSILICCNCYICLSYGCRNTECILQTIWDRSCIYSIINLYIVKWQVIWCTL